MNTETTFCNNRSIGLTNDRPISAASSSHSSHSSSSSSPTHFHRSSVPHHHRFGGGGGGGGGGGPLNGSTTRGAPPIGHQQQQQRRPASPTLERVSHAGSPPPLKTDVPRQTGPESRVPGRETPVPPESRRWVPPSLRPQHGLTQEAQIDAVFRTVRGILNKLTPENFQKLSDDLLKIDLNSKVILNGVIHLLFEKALDEQKYSSMYAQLCKRLSVEAPNFDEGAGGGAAAAAAAASGPTAAGAAGAAAKSSNNTFLVLLLNVCRDRFLNRNSIDHYSNQGSSLGTGSGGAAVVSQQNDAHLSDADLEEKLLIAKHKMLGNVKFIGELAKLDMLTDDRLHKCVMQLLDKNRSSSAKDRCEDLECLSQLIRTCGANLDTVKGKVLMDQYFDVMERYSHSPKYPARIRFMLRDVIELRKRDWVPRKQTAEGPMPIDQLQSDDDHSRSPFGGGGRNQHSGGGRGNGGGGGGGHHHGGGGGGHHGHHHHHQHQHQHHGSAAGDQEPHNWMNKMSSMSLSGGGGQGGHHGGDYGLSMTNSSHYSQPYNSSPGGGGGHYNNRDYRDGGRGGGGGNMDYRHNNQRNNYNSYGNNNSGGGNNYGNNQNNRYNNGNNNGGNIGGGGSNVGKGMMGSGQHNNGVGGGNTGGGYGQNNANNIAMNNKDLAPRFKRNLINAASTAAADPADALTFRPAANSLLFKANVNINAAQLPLVQQQSRSNGGLLGSNPNSLHNTGNTAGGGQQLYGSSGGGSAGNTHQDIRLNPYGQNHVHGNSSLLSSNSSNSSSSGNGHSDQAAPAVVSIASKLMPPQPVNNLLKKDQILIKQASLEKPKQTKKDKGPFKEDVLKRVQAFVVEQFVNAPVSDAVDEEEEEDDENIDGNETKVNADAAQPESQTKQAADEENIIDGGEEHQQQQQPTAVVEVSVETAPAVEVIAVEPKQPKAKIAPGAAQLAAFIDMKIPDKFMRDTMTTILDEIVDKPEPVHERVFQLLVALRRDGKLPTAAVLDGFRGVLKNDAIHPRIATHAATLLCRAVTAQLCRIQDVAQLADNGQHYPLFLLVLQQLHRQLGKQALLSAYAASKVQLMGTLPEPDRNKERMAAILQDRGLSYLYPLLKLQGELQKQIEADANPAQLYKWIKDNVDSTCYGDPGFITALMNVLLKYITQETTLAEGSDRSKNPDKAVILREKQLLERYCPVLQAFLRGQSDLELVAIYVLQTFCHASAFPKGMLLRWFTALYDLNVVEEESFLRWKEDLSDVYPGKGQALFQVNSYLTWLEQVDSEDEDDDDE